MALGALTWAWQQRVEPTAKLVLMKIADCEAADGKCWVFDTSEAAELAEIPWESWDAYTMLLGALGFIRDQGIGEDPTGARGRWYVLNR